LRQNRSGKQKRGGENQEQEWDDRFHATVAHGTRERCLLSLLLPFCADAQQMNGDSLKQGGEPRVTIFKFGAPGLPNPNLKHLGSVAGSLSIRRDRR
jgi:hypothetical protein